MKKFVYLLTTILLVLFCATAFAGCQWYHSKPGKIDQIVGTYELTTYSGVPAPEDNKEEGPTGEEYVEDLKAKYSIVAYLVVDSNGYGYYIYQDNNTPMYCNPVKITYTADEDSTEYGSGEQAGDKLIKCIGYNDGYREPCMDYPGNHGETSLGVNVKQHTLSYSGKRHKFQAGRLYYYDGHAHLNVEYTRISEKTDLSTVNEKLGTSFTAKRFELQKLVGNFQYEQSDENYMDNPFVACYLQINDNQTSGTIYYANRNEITKNTTDFASVIHQASCNITFGATVQIANGNFLTPITISNCNVSRLEGVTFYADSGQEGETLPTMFYTQHICYNPDTMQPAEYGNVFNYGFSMFFTDTSLTDSITMDVEMYVNGLKLAE